MSGISQIQGSSTKKVHHASRLYQVALSQLRDENLERFEEIRARLFKENGMTLRPPKRAPKREELLQAIADTLKSTGKSPSNPKLAKSFRTTTETMRVQTNKLIDAGFLERISPHRVELTAKGWAAINAQ